MSAWLRRARVSLAAFVASCGGIDVLSGDERSLINRATQLVEELLHIEATLGPIATCDAFSVSVEELTARYFCASGELRFFLTTIAKRQAKAAAA
jgi:hypothetical protein